MFANVGWGEMLLLVVIGLVVLGPERLPGAIQWTARTIRQARDYLSGATRELREELGPEFDDLRQPLNEIQRLRGMTPRAAITKHLLDGDDSWLTGEFESNGQTAGGAGAIKPKSADVPPVTGPAGGPAPFDSDAT
jgi:sec-independent protein translocase protein TatB